MGSRLSRQSSLDNENFSKKRRKLLDGTGESDRGSRGGGDFLFALMLKSDKLPGMLRRSNHSPYMRRVTWIKEIQKLLRDRRIEQATDVLKLLRKVSSCLHTHYVHCCWEPAVMQPYILHLTQSNRWRAGKCPLMCPAHPHVPPSLPSPSDL